MTDHLEVMRLAANASSDGEAEHLLLVHAESAGMNAALPNQDPQEAERLRHASSTLVAVVKQAQSTTESSRDVIRAALG
jgi:hypothetical protein